MFGIYNKSGERLHQFGAFTHEADAFRVLRKAMDKLPLAGCRVKVIPAEGMTKKEFDGKWHDADVDRMDEERLREFKKDCFLMYETTGFLPKFNSPYDDGGEHNGMDFKVVRRAVEGECDLEAMPLWLVEFENGDTAFCYPEEICKVENKTED